MNTPAYILTDNSLTVVVEGKALTMNSNHPSWLRAVQDIKDENWDKVLKFVAKNKALGMSKIIKTLETKYKIKATVKTELIKSLENE